MTMARKSLPERMDDFARWTRIPALSAAVAKVRRRHLRWTSAIALGAATLGMGVALARTDMFRLGYALVMLGFTIGMVLPIFGPLKPWGSTELIDEWDRDLRRRAFFAGFASVSVAALLGLWLLIALTLLANWDRTLLLQALVALALYLFTLLTAVPTFHASWTTRPVAEEEAEG
jgi:hypothetical protein